MRPTVPNVATAVATAAAGIAVNVATGPRGGVIGWLLVALCALASGVVATLVDHRLSSADPVPPPDPDDRAALPALVMEVVIRPDGSSVHRATTHTEHATDALLRARGIPALAQPESQNKVAVPHPVPVALVTRGRSAGIARRLDAIGARYRDSDTLQVRVCIDDDPARRRDALRQATAVFLDDHRISSDGRRLVGDFELAGLRGIGGDAPPVLLVVLGCRDGYDDHHTLALRNSLHAPTAVLRCAGPVPAEHRTVLFPAVLDTLGTMAGTRVTADDVIQAMDRALLDVRRDRPQMDWARWKASVLHPRV
jgi:hypothetical protein